MDDIEVGTHSVCLCSILGYSSQTRAKLRLFRGRYHTTQPLIAAHAVGSEFQGRLMQKVKKLRGDSEERIRRRLLQGIFEQRMPPGARLTEEALAETFKVSRTVIRQVIARLAQNGILVKDASGATHVASPSRVEAKQILAVRRMIEPEVVRSIASRAGSISFTALMNHLESEDNARRADDRGALVRLTGEFHLLLVQLTENPILVRLMSELQGLICLAILLYANGDEACPDDEHRRIVEALKAGQGEKSAEIMLHHLHHIEMDLHLDEAAKRDVQISSALNWLSGNATTG